MAPSHGLGLEMESSQIISAIDELSLWSAPFGLRLLDAVRCRPNTRALDVGCGLGFPLTELSMRLGSTSVVYGIDPWLGALRRNKQKLEIYEIENSAIICGYAEFLPFRDRVFNLITSNNGLNNVKDLVKAFAEIARVTERGGQLVFTFNTDRTFLPFYEAYRETLYDLGLPEYNEALRNHIRKKRKPVALFDRLVSSSGFRVNSIHEDSFTYRFSDADAMMRHFFIRLAFMGDWESILPARHRNEAFSQIERRLDERAGNTDGINLPVPFVTFDCERL